MKKTNEEIILEIYRRMYVQSKPKGNIDKMIKTGEGKMPDFFLGYYLSEEDAEKIFNNIFKEYKIKKYLRPRFKTEIILGAEPCSVKEIVEKSRKDYTKRLKKFLGKNKK